MWRFGRYHYLNSHCTCIRKSITLISIGAKLSDKCYSWFAATMLLPIQVDTNMASNHFPEYLAYKKVHWIVARSLHIYFRPFISQVLDFIYWTVFNLKFLVWEWKPITAQQLLPDVDSLRNAFLWSGVLMYHQPICYSVSSNAWGTVLVWEQVSPCYLLLASMPNWLEFKYAGIPQASQTQHVSTC